jgi:hypothetical protein
MEALLICRDLFLPGIVTTVAVMLASLVGGATTAYFLRQGGESPYSMVGLLMTGAGCYAGFLFGPYMLYLVPLALIYVLLLIPIKLEEFLYSPIVDLGR